MKLKYVDVKRFGALVNENADIKVGDIIYDDVYTKSCTISKGTWKGDVRSGFPKIIFAEKELNLPVPIFNWRDWEVEKEWEKHFNSKFAWVQNMIPPYTVEDYQLFKDLFIAGYNHNKAKYTEEDLINYSEWYIKNVGRFSDDSQTNKKGEYLKIYMQSLQKQPKFIVMESKSKFHCSTCNFKDLPKNNFCQANCKIHETEEPKLILNLEGKQEGIIKEIIY